MPTYGQFQTPEAPSALTSIHVYPGTPLKAVDHEPKMAVLEQENFARQGIDTSTLFVGAPKIDAAGNCVYNAGTVGLSNALTTNDFLTATGCTDYNDTKRGEEFALLSYHFGTDQTGTPDQEWPPTDCGSSGPYLVQYFQSKGWISGQRIAHTAQDIVSMFQTDGVLIGGPFLNAWEEPDANGFVDGNGSYNTLEDQIQLGIAGGHERYGAAIEKLVLTATGQVVPEETVIRERNSWGASWGDHGSFRIHLSTWMVLARYNDFRQFVA